jgi:hypothetical protein
VVLVSLGVAIRPGCGLHNFISKQSLSIYAFTENNNDNSLLDHRINNPMYARFGEHTYPMRTHRMAGGAVKIEG